MVCGVYCQTYTQLMIWQDNYYTGGMMKGQWQRYVKHLLGASQKACLSSCYRRKSICLSDRKRRSILSEEYDDQVSVVKHRLWDWEKLSRASLKAVDTMEVILYFVLEPVGSHWWILVREAAFPDSRDRKIFLENCQIHSTRAALSSYQNQTKTL